MSQSQQTYVPQYRSGGYAILYWMYEQILNDNINLFTKKDIINGAQKYCKSSFKPIKSRNNYNNYTAWNGINRLEQEKYVIRNRKHGGSHKFRLTTIGQSIAKILYNKSSIDDNTKQISIKQSRKRQRFQMENNDKMNINIKESKKRQKTEVENDIIPIININNIDYELTLFYDTSEQENLLKTQFMIYNINNKRCKLPIGDFCWILQNHQNQWIYPIIIERKRMDDLISSIKDGRYKEQKWRMKQNLKQFKLIYLIEKINIKDPAEKNIIKQALIDTQVNDKFLVYHTNNIYESVKILLHWNNILYKQINQTLKKNRNNINYNFFKDENCIDLNKFLQQNKKRIVTAKILFGRQLMCIPGVTDIIAFNIIKIYPTLRHLFNAWNACQSRDEQLSLLHNKINGTCLEQFRDIDNNGIFKIDEELMPIANSMKKNEQTIYKLISKKLSERIYKCFNQINNDQI